MVVYVLSPGPTPCTNVAAIEFFDSDRLMFGEVMASLALNRALKRVGLIGEDTLFRLLDGMRL